MMNGTFQAKVIVYISPPIQDYILRSSKLPGPQLCHELLRRIARHRVRNEVASFHSVVHLCDTRGSPGFIYFIFATPLSGVEGDGKLFSKGSRVTGTCGFS